MASATPGGDTVVGSDVAMTERDQPCTLAVQRTASGLKRLHDGEIKRSGGGGGGGDADKDADQLPKVLEDGVTAAAIESKTDSGSGNSGGPQTQAPASGESEPTTAEPAAISATDKSHGSSAAAKGVDDSSGGGGGNGGGAAAADPSVEPADPTAAAPYVTDAAAGTGGTEASKPGQDGGSGGGGGDAKELPTDATASPSAKQPSNTAPMGGGDGGKAPDLASGAQFPPLSTEATEAGVATAKAEAEPGEGDRTFADAATA
ncbi:hypothetical protein VOLCADRAFT_93744 [Volvox carteri f. nagariensis]|uniref:Uncharacterized protein n=1 Tax=Volvox carteri f. nagariensis TaxID=3068 RepID=D8U2Y3_VOLCA|nr:uncharacterized protein VOLCADRAFT_93744 [Volvox carteri f. nagariensis]EFJ45982.1 hypothetical protein VOLCADRAFT_93744 [Volvox carteri f. nagariensis]|eukprot:XP_002953060.1 hypothetical protein VOLCADRAFT_93744 [Volvox carteri f. nagariensis]